MTWVQVAMASLLEQRLATQCPECLCPELEDYPCNDCPDPPPVCITCSTALAGACEDRHG
jgi:hypothetical protein